MQTDKILFSLCAFALFVGMVFSLSLPVFTTLFFDYSEYHFFIRQFAVGMLCIFIMWSLSQLDPDKFLMHIGFTIFLSCLLLMGVMHYFPESLVTSAGGAKRWIRLPGFSLAPVEFFKIGFVYFLAWSFARKLNNDKKSLKEEMLLILPYIAMFILVIYLIAVMQNDLGQVVVLALTFAVMAFLKSSKEQLSLPNDVFVVAICACWTPMPPMEALDVEPNPTYPMASIANPASARSLDIFECSFLVFAKLFAWGIEYRRRSASDWR